MREAPLVTRAPYRRPGQRRVLLVEALAPLARVLTRQLAERYEVVNAASVSQAVAVLHAGKRVDFVVSSYQLGSETAGKLFAIVRRRWPNVRRVLYADEQGLRRPARALAHIVVDTGAPLEALVDTLAQL
jgi:DNA-binding NtrC family response regulator